MSIAADAIAAAPIAQASGGTRTKVPSKRSTIATADRALVPEAR